MPTTQPIDVRVSLVRSDAAAIAAAGRFAELVAPGASERDRDGAHPRTELAALSRSGLLGIRVPRADGGADVSVLTLVEVVRIIAAADASLGQLPQGHYGNVERLRDARAVGVSAAARSRLLAGVLAGERIADAMSEGGVAHARAISTQLVPDAHGTLRLDGVKHYATGAASADWLAVAALDRDQRRVTAFVPRDAPGVEIDDTWTGMGQRTTASGSVVLEGVPVVAGYVRQEPETRAADSTRPVAKLLHAAIAAGLAQGALDAAARFVVDTARPRPAAGELGVTSAADDPFVALRIGELSARTQACAALVRDAARGLGDHLDPRDAEAMAAAAHAYSGEIALEVATELFSLGGARAADDRHNLHRFWRDARTHSLQDARDWRYRAAGRRLLDLARRPAPDSLNPQR